MVYFKCCQYCGRQIDAGAAKCPYCGEVFNPCHREYKQNPNAFNFSPKDQAKIDARRRVMENKAAGIACCPKCGSTSLTANKKGFGIGKAVIGASVAGPIGLVAYARITEIATSSAAAGSRELRIIWSKRFSCFVMTGILRLYYFTHWLRP